jgi:hypothetical protein
MYHTDDANQQAMKENFQLTVPASRLRPEVFQVISRQSRVILEPGTEEVRPFTFFFSFILLSAMRELKILQQNVLRIIATSREAVQSAKTLIRRAVELVRTATLTCEHN